MAERDPTFDLGLQRVSSELSERGSSDHLGATEMPAAHAQILERVMPIYRKYWWGEHDRANRAWIATQEPRIDRHGPGIADELGRAYRTPWPKEPMNVDVTSFALWAGAYTTLFPTHLTIAGTDPRNQGPFGLEIAFHEASHGLILPLKAALAAELEAQGKSARDLWHVLLFFTSGRAVERRIPGYVPYADSIGLYDRVNGWKRQRAALDKHWTPYLEGRTSFEAAIRETVRSL